MRGKHDIRKLGHQSVDWENEKCWELWLLTYVYDLSYFTTSNYSYIEDLIRLLDDY